MEQIYPKDTRKQARLFHSRLALALALHHFADVPGIVLWRADEFQAAANSCACSSICRRSFSISASGPSAMTAKSREFLGRISSRSTRRASFINSSCSMVFASLFSSIVITRSSKRLWWRAATRGTDCKSAHISDTTPSDLPQQEHRIRIAVGSGCAKAKCSRRESNPPANRVPFPKLSAHPRRSAQPCITRPSPRLCPSPLRR